MVQVLIGRIHGTVSPAPAERSPGPGPSTILQHDICNLLQDCVLLLLDRILESPGPGPYSTWPLDHVLLGSGLYYTEPSTICYGARNHVLHVDGLPGRGP